MAEPSKHSLIGLPATAMKMPIVERLQNRYRDLPKCDCERPRVHVELRRDRHNNQWVTNSEHFRCHCRSCGREWRIEKQPKAQ